MFVAGHCFARVLEYSHRPGRCRWLEVEKPKKISSLAIARCWYVLGASYPQRTRWPCNGAPVRRPLSRLRSKRPSQDAELGTASEINVHNVQRARRRRRRSHRRWSSCSRRAHHYVRCRRMSRASMYCGSFAGHLPSCLCGGGRITRRLFRCSYRALFGPIDWFGGAQTRARAHEPPIAGTIELGDGGANRGGDM
jgi:hypothetical protein